MAKGSDNRSEKPTPRRKREARQEGRIPRSPEVAAWTAMLAATVILPFVLRSASGRMQSMMHQMARLSREPSADEAVTFLADGLFDVMLAVAPLLVGMMLIGVVMNLAQVGLVLTPKALRPDFKRLNPWTGFKRLFSSTTLWEAAKQMIKLAILSGLVIRSLPRITSRLVSGRPTVEGMMGFIAQDATRLARELAFAALVLAVLDYAFQRRKVGKALMMSRTEIKDEFRQQEGSPMMRSAIRSRQMAISRNRMMAEIGRSEVVILNPTHYAVAIAYDAGHGVPQVVAKGAGEVAARIRAEAAKHHVPMVEEAPLARLLFRVCDIGADVPANLYDAIARVLAFIYGLKAVGRAYGVHTLPPAMVPDLPDVHRRAGRPRARAANSP